MMLLASLIESHCDRHAHFVEGSDGGDAVIPWSSGVVAL